MLLFEYSSKYVSTLSDFEYTQEELEDTVQKNFVNWFKGYVWLKIQLMILII